MGDSDENGRGMRRNQHSFRGVYTRKPENLHKLWNCPGNENKNTPRYHVKMLNTLTREPVLLDHMLSLKKLFVDISLHNIVPKAHMWTEQVRLWKTKWTIFCSCKLLLECAKAEHWLFNESAPVLVMTSLLYWASSVCSFQFRFALRLQQTNNKYSRLAKSSESTFVKTAFLQVNCTWHSPELITRQTF